MKIHSLRAGAVKTKAIVGLNCLRSPSKKTGRETMEERDSKKKKVEKSGVIMEPADGRWHGR